MPDKLPMPVYPLSQPTRQELQVIAARREMEGAIIGHNLRAHYDEEAARIDARATAEATKATLETELDVLDWAIERGKGSATASKIIADRIEFLSRTNSANLNRRFGS